MIGVGYINLNEVWYLHSKNKNPVSGYATPVLGKPKQGCYVFWLFF